MDSETEASSSPETPKLDPKRQEVENFFGRLKKITMERQIRELEDLVVAQSRAIDGILARLLVLDKTYDPIEQLDWEFIQEAREVADRVERARPDVGS